jgi:hypothetical protein
VASARVRRRSGVGRGGASDTPPRYDSLLESASREFQFSRPLHRSEEDVVSVSPYSARGKIVGHPCKETGIECKCAYELKKEMHYFDIK